MQFGHLLESKLLVDLVVNLLIYFILGWPKLCFETKSTKLYSKMLLVKSSENKFVFLPAFYLIMCFMKAPKNFGKRAILKIWELIFLGGVKTHFKLALKWCIFRHEKINILGNIVLLLWIQLRFRHTEHLKMTVWTSVLWKILMYLAKKWPEMVLNSHLWAMNFQY